MIDYYVRNGMAEVTFLTLAGFQPNLPKLQNQFWFADYKYRHRVNNEKIGYNDCIYKTMYKFDYIAIFDTDEVIAPVQECL